MSIQGGDEAGRPSLAKLILHRVDLSGEFSATLNRASGAGLYACLQCKKCTSGCPISGRADFKPHELVRLAQLGQRDAVLACRTIWECTSCQTCVTRCPQKVDIAAMNDALRRMSRAAQLAHRETTLPIFNDAFLRSVRRNGRVYELGLMAIYKLRTGRLFEDLGELPRMLKKRKLRLLPGRVRGAAERRLLFQRVRAKGGEAP